MPLKWIQWHIYCCGLALICLCSQHKEAAAFTQSRTTVLSTSFSTRCTPSSSSFLAKLHAPQRQLWTNVPKNIHQSRVMTSLKVAKDATEKNKSTSTTSSSERLNSNNNDENEPEDEEESTSLSWLDALRFGIPSHIANPLALVLTSQFILFLGVGAVIPSIPLYGKEIGLSSSANGIVISAPAVALLLAAQWSGTVADKARKPAVIGGLLVIAISDLGTAVATNMIPLIIARLGLGLGRCTSEAGERGLLADLANRVPAKRGRLLAAQQAAIAMGIAIGAPLGGIVVNQYGPRAAFLCTTTAALVSAFIYSFLPETTEWDPVVAVTVVNEEGSTKTIPRKNENESASIGISKKQQHQDNNTTTKGNWIELLKNPQWRGLALCQSGATFGFAAKIASIPVLANALLPGGAIGAGALISVTGLSGLVGAPVGGWLTDRTGARTTAMLSGLFSSVSLMLIPVVLAILSTGDDDTTFLMIGGIALGAKAAAFSALVVCWGMGAAAQGPALTAVAQQLAPRGAEATCLALPRAAGDGTYILAPFLLGLVADSFETVTGAELALAGATTFLGAMALLWVTESEQEDIPPF